MIVLVLILQYCAFESDAFRERLQRRLRHYEIMPMQSATVTYKHAYIHNKNKSEIKMYLHGLFDIWFWKYCTKVFYIQSNEVFSQKQLSRFFQMILDSNPAMALGIPSHLTVLVLPWLNLEKTCLILDPNNIHIEKEGNSRS